MNFHYEFGFSDLCPHVEEKQNTQFTKRECGSKECNFRAMCLFQIMYWYPLSSPKKMVIILYQALKKIEAIHLYIRNAKEDDF